ncbi:SseB family protein [uncultured Phycicoccus sp.]|uniref:SseB family protein n=1 Tax=uncultured Phycicoccus sp. TaxID=661422 RepID=UPI0026121F54|nr:SseB family protein [uncultured Phycicoccus sp.]
MTPGGADSAEVPWGGRELSESGFETDTGEADPALRAALAGTADDATLMRAVEASRFLVPVVATATGEDEHDGHRVETGTDMAAVTLVAPDGRRALPVFTGADALAAWDPAARPVPVTPARAAQAAVSESCDVLVVDVAGPATRVLRPSMLWALAQERPWQPAPTDPFVARAVAAATAAEPDIVTHTLEEGTPAGEGVLGIVLTLRPGLAPDDVRAAATRVGERLATDGELRARVDGLAFRIV